MIKSRYLIVFLINLIYCGVLILFSDTDLVTAKSDTLDYLDPLSSIQLRTIGYPFFLSMFTWMNNWHIAVMLVQAIVSTWMFYVVYDMIGNKAWILVILGAFTMYVPSFLTDLLFAAVFVTSIWQIKKRLWLHFLLLGVAALIRPSLAWFFLIEPIILYYQGYRGNILFYSLVIVFLITSISPVLNYINGNGFIHSDVLHYNMNNDKDYFGGSENKLLYFYQAFKGNILGAHYNSIHLYFEQYPWKKIGYVISFINGLIWIRFLIRIKNRKINFGYILIVIYFVLPTLFGSTGGRLRLPIEWILLL